MFIPRKIYPQLIEHIDKKQISVITGMRRTGKTTLLKQLLSEIKSSNKLYIDLERADNRELFTEKNYENIVYALSQRGLNFTNKSYIAIDEIQLVTQIASVLKYIYDHHNVKFIVTGSSSFYLKNLFTESLSGRKKIFELYPLDFGELLTFKGISYKSNDFPLKKIFAPEFERLKAYYEEYIEYGGFPEVVLAKNSSDKKDLIADILSSYINIDIKILSDFRNEKNIYSLIKMLSARVGTRLDYSKLSRLSGLSRPTVHSYIDFFEKTYLISRISVLAKNPDREIVKAQKLYFNDHGMTNMLADINSGSKFENAVFNQLKHKGDIRYFALKSGKEIDFIVNNKIASEVKESPNEYDLKILNDLSSKLGIDQTMLIGRYLVKRFDKFTWGGDIK